MPFEAPQFDDRATAEADPVSRVEALERERRERLERMSETFAQLARLTHQINNPLTSLIGRVQLLPMMQADPERTAKALEVIEESSRRVADYVRELAQVVKASRERELDRD